VLDDVARAQAGMVSRAQALRCGLSDAAISARVTSKRWQRVHPGVFATFSGPLPHLAWIWAGVLLAGPDAVACGRTAAELIGLAEPAPGPVHVAVPHSRRVRPRAGLVVHRTVDAQRMRHAATVPPRTCLEETVIDLAQGSRTVDDAIGWLTRAVSGRFTTPDRLRTSMGERRRLRWRRELTSALRDVAAGCHSPLELRYRRHVERPHGLPAGQRQHRRDSWYDDVVYDDYCVHVELDGRRAHPESARFRDHRRDNAAVLGGGRVLRYGYRDVMERPCVVAREVATVLAAAGWPGSLRRCGPECVNGEVHPG
jgi:very-short-patch-repair endonuclease